LSVKDEELERNRLPTCFRDEIPGYVWARRGTKETPVKENDHALDAARYAVAYVDGLGRDAQTVHKRAKAWAF
jgi:phage terminase large subunit